MSFELRPYQTNSIESLREGFRQQHKRQVLAASTGAGKSLMSIHLIKQVVEKGKRALFVCDRRVLVDQFSKHLDAHGIDHGIYMAGHWRRRQHAQVQVASIQTLEKIGTWPIVDLIIIDEIHCFPAGTLIDDIPIENITIGDEVKSFNHATGCIEIKRVLAISKRKADSLVEISTTIGKIICTPEHPIWDGNNYKKAREFTKEDVLYYTPCYVMNGEENEDGKKNIPKRREDLHGKNSICMQDMCRGVSTDITQGSDIQENSISSMRQSGMPFGEEGVGKRTIQKKYESVYGKWRIGTHENKQSNMESRSEKQGNGNQERNWIYSILKWGQRRQWSSYFCSAINTIVGTWGRMVCRVCCCNKTKVKWTWLSNMLQNRYSSSRCENCNRSGWGVTQFKCCKNKGYEKNNILRAARVESISVQKCGSINGNCEDCSSDVIVYNLEVEGNNNYFANGVLVHNCVMRKSVKDMLTNNPNLNVIGLTATPFQKDLPDYFTSVTNVVTMEELVDDGFLVPLRVFGATEIDTKGVKVSMGEWQKDELEKRGLKVVGDVVADYIKIYTEVWGEPRRSIVFSSGVAHGTELVRKFAEHGLNFVQLSYLDSDEYKYEVLEEFAKPDTDILGVVSSDLLTRGFDNPKIEHVVIAKPLRKSFSMHVQMIGRGARPYPDKKFAVIQDNAGNWKRFEDDWDELYHNGVKTLESDADKKTRKEPTEKEKTASKCPRCKQIWPTLKTDICPTCGFKRERKCVVEAVAGEMVELTGNVSKEKFSKEVKQAWYSQMLGYAKSKGYKDGYAYYSFHSKFGIFPHHSLEKIPAPMTPEVRNFITHLAIKKSKQNR